MVAIDDADMNIEYGCVVGSWDRYNGYVAPRTAGRRVHTRFGETSIASAYNSILNTSTDLDALILVHDDLEIIDPHAEVKFLDVLNDPDVALVGVCGGTSDHSLAWWNGERVGHQMLDSGPLDFGPRTGDVAILEGSILCFSPWAVQVLRFDERFQGFHGYDEICVAARRLHNKRVVVADVDTHHHNRIGHNSQTIAEAWAAAEAQFQEKWWHR